MRISDPLCKPNDGRLVQAVTRGLAIAAIMGRLQYATAQFLGSLAEFKMHP